MRKRTDRFETERFVFDSNDFGISLDFQGTDENSALDHFRLIFDDDFMAKILEETTRYNLCLIQKVSSSKRCPQGIDTNIPEIYTFFALYNINISNYNQACRRFPWKKKSVPKGLIDVFGRIRESRRSPLKYISTSTQ